MRLKSNVLTTIVVSFLMVLLASSRPAEATSFQPGDLVTYGQTEWGGDPNVDAGAALLVAQYDNVYAGTFGLVSVGSLSGFTLTITDPTAAMAYMPSIGAFGSLNASVLDPISTMSGAFGGEVLGLQFNVDFTDAGVLFGSSGIRFGDLVLANFAAGSPFNGLRVRDFLADANTLLAGGSTVFDFTNVDGMVGSLNAAFADGNPSQFAQDHLIASAAALPPSSVPEPPTMLLIAAPALTLAVRRRAQRRTRVGDAS